MNFELSESAVSERPRVAVASFSMIKREKRKYTFGDAVQLSSCSLSPTGRSFF